VRCYLQGRSRLQELPASVKVQSYPCIIAAEWLAVAVCTPPPLAPTLVPPTAADADAAVAVAPIITAAAVRVVAFAVAAGTDFVACVLALAALLFVLDPVLVLAHAFGTLAAVAVGPITCCCGLPCCSWAAP
jgi:hypothetical protein